VIPRLAKSCLCLALLALAASAEAGYPRYSAPSCGTYACPTYSQPASYSYSYAPTYSGWTYRLYPGTDFYYRVRHVTHYGYAPQVETDPYLYTLAGGCYAQHCLISDYLARPAVVLQPAAKLAIIGTADYGVDPLKYAVAKAYGTTVAGILQQQYPPSAVDVGSLLPPATTERPARLEAALKTSTSATEALKSIAMGDQDNERRESEARRQLALQANKLQSFERMLGKFNEMAAVADQQATFSATASLPQIQTGDPQLSQLIATSCLRCHGGEKTEKGLDFKQAGTFDDDTWLACVAQVATGAMPRGGTPLKKDEVGLFKAEYKRSLARASQ
jgi:hypothetical protein